MPVALRRLQPFTKQGFSRSAVGLDDDEMDNMASLMESALPRKGYYCFDFHKLLRMPLLFEPMLTESCLHGGAMAPQCLFRIYTARRRKHTNILSSAALLILSDIQVRMNCVEQFSSLGCIVPTNGLMRY
ncbi:uncharacterized protein METZ01_LOCUS395649 [marine metagenome]|uniref:Uncharacterized protein n=1 Tax=marine metagenome TaxID=408172 RepID=A0A382V9T2_9ZZZZ